MTPKSPPPTGATPQQEIFQRFPALFSISQKRQPPLPSLRGTAQTIRPANQYSPPPRGSCHLSATGGVALKSSEYPKVKFSRSFPSPWGDARGVLVPGGHRPGPTEAAAETCPLEKTLYYFENRNPPPVPISHPPPLISLTGGGGGWEPPEK